VWHWAGDVCGYVRLGWDSASTMAGREVCGYGIGLGMCVGM
jgi:hypothetical protein